jgi:hypothetical protein
VCLKMGNLFQRTSAANDGADYPTPKIVALTSTEIDIIKETWKIPSANVSYSSFEMEVSA